MQTFLILLLSISGGLQMFTHAIDSTPHNLVCPPCNCSCSAEQGIVSTTVTEGLIENTDKDETSKEPVTTKSCHGISLESAKSRNETGGVFDLNVPEIGVREVYCDVRTDGGDWTVFQRRMDGSVDFDRVWNDYDNGFGNANGEFWLGLAAIHQFTKAGNHELRFDMIEKDGTYYYAKYSSFKVGPASDNYRLSVSGYSGNATDSFADSSVSNRVHNEMKFSARDRDNDGHHGGHCAAGHRGGWWFNACFHSFLNGRYDNMRWYHQTSGWMNMRFTEMKLRQK